MALMNFDSLTYASIWPLRQGVHKLIPDPQFIFSCINQRMEGAWLVIEFLLSFTIVPSTWLRWELPSSPTCLFGGKTLMTLTTAPSLKHDWEYQVGSGQSSPHWPLAPSFHSQQQISTGWIKFSKTHPTVCLINMRAKSISSVQVHGTERLITSALGDWHQYLMEDNQSIENGPIRLIWFNPRLAQRWGNWRRFIHAQLGASLSHVCSGLSTELPWW